ncbi:MAG: glycosyltransferase family 2 protein [Clostridia bacterium]|nr:glycosyltransferase family 2 protein [Clostridia bacterium]
MNDKPLISIVMPVYKVEKYIRKSLDCVVNQTYTNLEIILVDDGSPDNCPKICDEYAAKDSRIKVIHKENGGIGSARNAGLKNSTGDYIIIFDPDDYVTSDICEKAIDAAVRHDADIVVFNYKKIDADGNFIKKINRKNPIKLPGEETELTSGKLFDMIVSVDSEIGGFTWNKLIKREKIKDMRYIEERIASEDLLFMQRVPERLENIIYIPDELYFYIMHPSSASNAASDTDITEIYIRDEIMVTAKKYFPEHIDMCLFSMAEISFQVIKRVKNHRDAVKKCSKIMRKYMGDIVKCKRISAKQRFFYVLCSICPRVYLTLRK